MNTKDLLIKKLQERIRIAKTQIAAIRKMPKLAELEIEPTFCNEKIDFDHLPHSEVIKVIKAVGGKWLKTPSYECARIDYETKVGDLTFRCWKGEPPPNCRLVTVKEVIPAQPEQIIERIKLVCK
jgi:hypothetical protein